MKSITIILISICILVIGCATLTNVARQELVQQLTKLFPDVDQTILEAIADRIIGIGAESLSELCGDVCLDASQGDEALCSLICTEREKSLQSITEASPEPDVFFPEIVQGY